MLKIRAAISHLSHPFNVGIKGVRILLCINGFIGTGERIVVHLDNFVLDTQIIWCVALGARMVKNCFDGCRVIGVH